MANQADIINLDIRGQICPSSLLLVLREVNARNQDLINGDCLISVTTDNRDATGTIPSAVENMGLKAVVEKINDYYQIIIMQRSESNI